jgi:hypothetical protein
MFYVSNGSSRRDFPTCRPAPRLDYPEGVSDRTLHHSQGGPGHPSALQKRPLCSTFMVFVPSLSGQNSRCLVQNSAKKTLPHPTQPQQLLHRQSLGKRVVARHSLRTTHLLLSLPYGCSKPVLVKWSFFTYQMLQNMHFPHQCRGSRRTIAELMATAARLVASSSPLPHPARRRWRRVFSPAVQRAAGPANGLDR